MKGRGKKGRLETKFFKFDKRKIIVINKAYAFSEELNYNKSKKNTNEDI